MQDFFRYFTNTGDGVFALDARQRIIFWNQTAQGYLGHTPEAVRGRHCYDVLQGRGLGDERVCGAHCLHCEQARAGQPIRAFDLRVKNRQGRSVWINLSGIALPDFSNDESYGGIVYLFRLVEAWGEAVPPLKIRLLGPVLAQRADGSPVRGAFRRHAKVRALFSLLALHRSQGMLRNELIAILWPRLNRAAGLHNLNTSVYLLRRSLEPDLQRGQDSTYLRIQGERYILAGGRTNWLDVEEFEAGLTAARRETEADEQIRLCRQAIGLYRGDYLADLDAFLLDSWMDRERYRQLYLNALQALGDLLAAQGHAQEAADVYLRLWAKDACNEPAVQALMHMFLDRGDRTGALAIYERFSKTLHAELDTEPAAKTQRLARKARARG